MTNKQQCNPEDSKEGEGRKPEPKRKETSAERRFRERKEKPKSSKEGKDQKLVLRKRIEEGRFSPLSSGETLTSGKGRKI